MEGWIKLHRKLTENAIWTSEPFTRGQAWVDLLILARHKNGYFYKRGNKIELKRGQIGWSIVALAERWMWSRGKVMRYLNELEMEQQIEQQKMHITTLISILNYNDYQYIEQQTGQQTGSRRAADGQQTDINNNVKKDKQLKEYKEFITMFNEITNRDFKGTSKSKSQFNARFNEGFILNDFKIAITNCFNDDFHKANTKYLTPEFITRSEKLQQYLNIKIPKSPYKQL